MNPPNKYGKKYLKKYTPDVYDFVSSSSITLKIITMHYPIPSQIKKSKK
jgi:hypothetical protein